MIVEYGGSPRRTGLDRPPRFCRIDGMSLIDDRKMLSMGFDAYTGLELPKIEHVSRRCPTSMHDVWVLHADGWVLV